MRAPGDKPAADLRRRRRAFHSRHGTERVVAALLPPHAPDSAGCPRRRATTAAIDHAAQRCLADPESPRSHRALVHPRCRPRQRCRDAGRARPTPASPPHRALPKAALERYVEPRADRPIHATSRRTLRSAGRTVIRCSAPRRGDQRALDHPQRAVTCSTTLTSSGSARWAATTSPSPAATASRSRALTRQQPPTGP